MNRMINRLVSEATAPIGEMSTRLFKKAVLFFLLFFLGLSCVCVSAIFMTIALFVFLQPLEGNAEAALCVAGLYLAAAGVCVFFATRAMSKPRQAAASFMEKKIMPSENAEYAQKAEFANNIDETLAPILTILQERGMERERLALEAGAEITKQLHPFALIAFATVAGYIFGRILRRNAPLA
jgi:hypothetical protein